MQPIKSVSIIFASQTGVAESIAKRIHALVAKEFPALEEVRLLSTKQHAQLGLEQCRLAVFVVSSTGQGDPPDNALSFWRFLSRRTHPPNLLADLRYTVLGSPQPLPRTSPSFFLMHALVVYVCGV